MARPSVASSVLRQLRLRRGVSRVELARQLTLAPSTVGLHVDRLVSDGYLREGGRREGPRRSRTGRPPTVVELNPEAGQFVGVDLDGRTILAASVDFSQKLLRDRREPIRASDNAEDVLARIEEVVEDVRDRHRSLLGLGLAVPGSIDADRGVGVRYEHIRGWRDVPFADRLTERFGVPVQMENNVRTMAMAERWFGCARDVEDVLCLGIRSGIGSGMIINGELHRGPDGLAGEIGAWPVAGDADAGATLEETASLRAMESELAEAVRDGRKTRLTLRRNRVWTDDLCDAARNEDPLVLGVLDRAAKSIGRVAAQMTMVMNPRLVVVCGPLAELQDAFVEPLRREMFRRLPRWRGEQPALVASGLGEYIGAFGAAALAAHTWHPSDD